MEEKRKRGRPRKVEGAPTIPRKTSLKGWSDDFYVKAYRLAASGMNLRDIASSLGTTKGILEGWMEEKPALKKAILGAKKSITGTAPEASFREYVYNRLDPELKELWDAIHLMDQGGKDYSHLLQRVTIGVRQNLFIHALVHCNFNMNEACRLAGISLGSYSSWCRDPKFKRLMESINWHKKNFFESALMDLVRGGDSNAILFVNKTANRDRGYSEKVEVNVSGTIEHKVSADNLPLEVRKALLEAYRKGKTEDRVEYTPEEIQRIGTQVPVEEKVK